MTRLLTLLKKLHAKALATANDPGCGDKELADVLVKIADEIPGIILELKRLGETVDDLNEQLSVDQLCIDRLSDFLEGTDTELAMTLSLLWERSTPEQRKTIKMNYPRWDPGDLSTGMHRTSLEGKP